MQCRECASTDIVQDLQSGDSVCTSCGLVLDDHAWDFDTQLYASEPIQPTLTSQTISNCPKRFLHASGDSSRARSLIVSCCELRMCAATLGLPDSLSDHARKLWETINTDHICRGDLRVGVADAFLYYACKLASFPRSKRKVASCCNVTMDTLNKALKVYSRILRPARSDDVLMAKPTDSADVLASCVQEAVAGSVVPAYIVRKLTAQARLADQRVSDSGVLEGKTPQVRAAAAVSLAMRFLELPNRDKLYKAVGVSIYTLQRTVALVEDHV